MDWSREIIEDCKTILSKHTTISEALSEINPRVGEVISSSALRNAFQRFGQRAPSSYLGTDTDVGGNQECAQEAAGATTSDSLALPHRYTLDFERNAYTLSYDAHTYILSFEDVETMCVMYSDVEPGLKKTAEEVALFLHNDCGYEWASPGIVQWFLKAIGQTKKRHPEAPHQLGDDYEAVFSQMRFRRHAALSAVDRVEKQQKLAKEVERLRKDFSTLVDAKDGLEGLKVERTSFLDMGEDSSPHRTLVIPIADLHAGKKVTPQPLAKDQNVYNKQVVADRVKQICRIICEHGKQHADKYDQIYISGLGDYWEALFLNMRDGQSVDADAMGIEQWRMVVESFVKIIGAVRDSFPGHIKCVIQSGNHDRALRDKSFRSEEVLGYILVDYLAEYFAGDVSIEILYGAGVVSVAINESVNLVSTHGHLSNLTREADIIKFVSVHGESGFNRYLVLQGHWHHFKVLTGYNFRAIWLPAICGNDLFNLNQLNTGSPSEFMMVEVSGENISLVGPYLLN